MGFLLRDDVAEFILHCSPGGWEWAACLTPLFIVQNNRRLYMACFKYQDRSIDKQTDNWNRVPMHLLQPLYTCYTVNWIDNICE